MALDHTWDKIQQLSERLRVAVRDDPDRVSDLWAERQTLLENILNESSLSALSTQDLAWLRDAVEQLQKDDEALRQEVKASQLEVIDQLRQQSTQNKAVHAYLKQTQE